MACIKYTSQDVALRCPEWYMNALYLRISVIGHKSSGNIILTLHRRQKWQK